MGWTATLHGGCLLAAEAWVWLLTRADGVGLVASRIDLIRSSGSRAQAGCKRSQKKNSPHGDGRVVGCAGGLAGGSCGAKLIVESRKSGLRAQSIRFSTSRVSTSQLLSTEGLGTSKFTVFVVY